MASIDDLAWKYFSIFQRRYNDLNQTHEYSGMMSAYEAVFEEAKKDPELAKDIHNPALEEIEAMKEAYVANSFRCLAQPEEAVKHFKKALSLGKHDLVMAVILEFKGIYGTQSGDPEQAIKDQQRALDYYKKAGHFEKVARVSSTLGAAYTKKEEYEKAISHFTQARAAADDVLRKMIDEKDKPNKPCTDRYNSRSIHMVKADAYQGEGEALTLQGTMLDGDAARDKYARAIKWFDNSLGIAERLEHTAGFKAVVNLRKAYTYAMLGEETKSKASYRLFQINAESVQPNALEVIKPYIEQVEYFLGIRK